MDENRTFILRGHKVVLSTDLAAFYRVEQRAILQTIRRNLEKFPEELVFELTDAEHGRLGGVRRANPYAFTEPGIDLLARLLTERDRPAP